MHPLETGKKYDKIATWWQQHHLQSNYGVEQLKKALQFIQTGGHALDVGCGAGGRMVRLLDEHGFSVTGIDVSEEMIRLAKSSHIDHIFLQADICEFEASHSFDFILAWDSIFHLPIEQHKPVLNKLCKLLSPYGILIYTFGNAIGSSESIWREDTFAYSSIGINENLNTLIHNQVTPMHLELDQYPESHVLVIGKKNI